MLVKTWMTRKVYTIEVDDSMSKATDTMKYHDISFLPVLKGNKLVGVVTDRDIKRASVSDVASLDLHELEHHITKVTVKSIMSKPVHTLPLDYTVEEAAEGLMLNKISGAPVMDPDGNLAGVITRTDLLRVLISLTAHGGKGIQIALRVKDRRGIFKAVAHMIRDYEGSILNVLTSRQNVPEGFRELYIRIQDLNRKHLNPLLEKLEEKATLLYWVDHKKNKRKVYPVSTKFPKTDDTN